MSNNKNIVYNINWIYFWNNGPGFSVFLSKNRVQTRTTDTQWRHKSKISEKLGRSGRQNMLRPYLTIWEWEWIFGRAVKAFSSLGVRSPWVQTSKQKFATREDLLETWKMSRAQKWGNLTRGHNRNRLNLVGVVTQRSSSRAELKSPK